MKNTIFTITAIVGLIFILSAFTLVKPGSINGSITPAEALKDVWIVSTKDTLRGIVVQGNFTVVNVRPGTYKVVINAVDPYQDVIVEGINVTEGQPVDVGEIKLKK